MRLLDSLSSCRSTSGIALFMVLNLVAGFTGSATAQDVAVAEPPAKQSTALNDYVKAKDDSYQWKVKKESKLGKTAYAELIMQSQTWRGFPWKHQLFVLKPTTVAADNKHALLIIAGGAWRDELEEDNDEARPPREAMIFAAAAEKLGMPVVVLMQVPQQPMFNDLYEDALISHTFVKYMESGESDWPLLLPMTKSAVRGMDAAQEYLGKLDKKIPVEKFVVTGASKRGWTTWLSSVADDRVTAIAPMVIDVLNMPRQMKFMEECWGAQSEQIKDYTEKGLHRLMETERGRELNAIVDPYRYRDQITEPKYLLLGTNDAYWPVDALNIYWNELKGPKHILYVPNAGHGLDDMTRVVGGLVNFGRISAAGKTFPKIQWEHTDASDKVGVTLTLPLDAQPKKVRLWIAKSKDRDFRNERWSSTEMSPGAGSDWVGSTSAVDSGYQAVFGEVEMEGEGFPYFLSTTIEVYEADK